MRARDQRGWIIAAAVAMFAVGALDRFRIERFHAPVGSIVIGPLLAAIACSPVVVGAFLVLAASVRFVFDVTDPDVSSAQMGFNVGAVTLVGGIALVAAVARDRRERELAMVRPAQRLTSLSASLAAARSVEEVEEAFTTMARADLGARSVRFVLRGDIEPAEDDRGTFVAPLSVASGVLGRVEISFDEPPGAEAIAVVEQGLAQTSVALGRVQGARTLAVTARRLAALQRCTSQLAGLLRTDDIARAMVVEARQTLQADRAVFHVLDDDIVRVAATDGAGGSEYDAVSVADSDTPAAEAIRSGLLVVRESPHSTAPAYPRGTSDDRSFVTVPIFGGDGPVAALHLGWDRPHRVDEEELAMLGALVTLISAAWRRASRFEDEERERTESAHRAERAARLAALAATLAEARDRAAVAAAFTEHGLQTVDASWGGLFELDEARGVLRLLSGRTASSVWFDGMTVPLDRAIALTDAVRDAKPVMMGTRDEVLARHPDEDVHPAQHARAAIPLLTYGGVIGVLGFAWDEPHPFDDGEIEFLQTIATRTSEAFERGRLHEAEREDERRWNLLAEASAVLAGALEPTDVINALVGWAVPLVADTCAVYLVQPDGTARPYGSVHLPEAPGAAALLSDERVDLTGDHPVAELYRSRRTQLVEDLRSETMEAAVGRDPQRVDVLRELGIRHVLASPLNARNQQLGVLLLAMGKSGRRFGATDVELASDLASRFSIVYDNAVLFATERNIAARLQGALLPASLNAPAGLSVAVRYAASGSRAGGDWYDLIAFGESSAGLVVGDLVGHGVEAAATMSRYRSALRAHARMSDDPGEVMDAFSSFIRLDEVGQTATVLYSRIDFGDPRNATLSYCSAGHPPPIIVHDGVPNVLPSPQGPLIGLVSGGYTTHTVAIPPGSLVVLYTDGLVERRGESLDEGTARLQQALSSLDTSDLDRLVDRLLTAMAYDGHDDDVAVLIARVEPDGAAA